MAKKQTGTGRGTGASGAKRSAETGTRAKAAKRTTENRRRGGTAKVKDR
jgi:hypothetical protein